MIDNRVRILEAARRVYSTFGWRGATTRRIAEAAGVNEVTIFRQFGNKEALLGAVMTDLAANQVLPPFPPVPLNPEAELILWAVAHHQRLCGMREMIRQMLGQVGERPEVASCAATGPQCAAALLREYVVRLRRNGWLDVGPNSTPAADAAAGVAMLMGTLFADAMGRDFMPEMFPTSADDAVGSYVRLFLRALGTQKTPHASANDVSADVAHGITVDVA